MLPKISQEYLLHLFGSSLNSSVGELNHSWNFVYSNFPVFQRCGDNLYFLWSNSSLMIFANMFGGTLIRYLFATLINSIYVFISEKNSLQSQYLVVGWFMIWICLEAKNSLDIAKKTSLEGPVMFWPIAKICSTCVVNTRKVRKFFSVVWKHYCICHCINWLFFVGSYGIC